jgi:hypothetical protein
MVDTDDSLVRSALGEEKSKNTDSVSKLSKVISDIR